MPIQLGMAWGPVVPEAVFSEGSEGWYVASENRTSSAANTSTSPKKIFRGRLRVGAKTMRIGFMAVALRLAGYSGKLPQARGWSGRRLPKQSSLSALVGWILGKCGRGEPRCGPPYVDQLPRYFAPQISRAVPRIMR